MKDHSNVRGTVLTRRLAAVLLLLALVANITFYTDMSEVRASEYSIMILSQYSKILKIGQAFRLAAISSSGRRITWKSSSSSIASVNTYGEVTAKKAGNCKITAKTTGGEASCDITVAKTEITLSATSVTLENGATFQLRGQTSNGSSITWKASRTSVASIDEAGRIQACKPGESVITASADGTKKTCRITVKKPKVRLNLSSVKLYRTKTCQLTASVSSRRPVRWRSKKNSVATVNDSGLVTAVKHGTATISATVDGITQECVVTVPSPEIRLSKTSVTLKAGASLVLGAEVSSGMKPIWKSSRSSVASVDGEGKIIARKKGNCYIHVSEDGTKESCHVTVTA